jgi:hypothetical protein
MLCTTPLQPEEQMDQFNWGRHSFMNQMVENHMVVTALCIWAVRECIPLENNGEWFLLCSK